jgi:hypothetical protein
MRRRQYQRGRERDVAMRTCEPSGALIKQGNGTHLGKKTPLHQILQLVEHLLLLVMYPLHCSSLVCCVVNDNVIVFLRS